MKTDELLPRGLVGLMGAGIGWLAWPLGAAAAAVFSPLTVPVAIGMAAIAFSLFSAVHRFSGLPASRAPLIATAGFAAFGCAALLVAQADAGDLLFRIAVTASQMAGGLLLGFSVRTTAVALAGAALLAAIATPFYGIVLLCLVAAAYLEAKPPGFLVR